MDWVLSNPSPPVSKDPDLHKAAMLAQWTRKGGFNVEHNAAEFLEDLQRGAVIGTVVPGARRDDPVDDEGFWVGDDDLRRLRRRRALYVTAPPSPRTPSPTHPNHTHPPTPTPTPTPTPA